MSHHCCPGLSGDFHNADCPVVADQARVFLGEPCPECQMVYAHAIECSKFWALLHQDEGENPYLTHYGDLRTTTPIHIGPYTSADRLDEYMLQFDRQPPFYTLEPVQLYVSIGSAIAAGLALGALIGYSYGKWMS